MTERVKIHHIRNAGHCLPGVRKHCQSIGVDFRRLVREGIPISEVEHIDDILVQDAIRRARKKEG